MKKTSKKTPVSFRLFVLPVLPALFLLFSCNRQERLFSDSRQWEAVQADFLEKKAWVANDTFFSVLEREDLSQGERQALTFLYAYMPLADMLDYPGSYFLRNVRLSFQAREEMPWGKTIPEKEFRHFVLPLRVNNEKLDDSREAFYRELKDRVKGLSLYDAVLEVNHWCHEKVVYQPTDARTSSPSATVKTAYGRCGEESTLLVAALRSVCIPARQVYTPRWAHTDDNHAWVEAYVDGTWHFLGACEPEPVLDLAWFNEPASRGMLMHTKVFGPYPGPEEIMEETPCYTEINVIGNYAKTAGMEVVVRDSSGTPLEGVPVEFKLYNYAEFYTVASRETDNSGKARLTAGLGDMLVWASDGGKFGFAKVSFGKDSVAGIVLSHSRGEEFSVELDVVPPEGEKRVLEVSPAQMEANKLRLEREDSLRLAYVGGFYDRPAALLRARALGMDTARLASILTGSRGNHAVLDSFLDGTAADRRAEALDFLEVLSEKDWRDIPGEVLEDHFCHTPSGAGDYEEGFYVRHVRNPRVEYENLSPYKSYFRSSLPQAFADSVVRDPAFLARWTRREIRVEDAANALAAPVSPKGVYEARVSDSRSRDIFFVSLLRSLGVASRIHPVNGKVQYALETDAWQDVDFSDAKADRAPKGTLRLRYRASPLLPDPEYYKHFSLSRFQSGKWVLQTYPEDGSSRWKKLFSRGQALDTGYYLLVSGTRLAGGETLARMSFFRVEEGKETLVDLVMRDGKEVIKVLGQFNSEALYHDLQAGQLCSILKTTGRGYFLVGLLGSVQEPAVHALRDLAAHRQELEAWGRPLLLLFPDEAAWGKYRREPVEGLPSTVHFGLDKEGALREHAQASLPLRQGGWPVFILGDTFNRVVFVSQGYDIGFGNRLMKTLRGI